MLNVCAVCTARLFAIVLYIQWVCFNRIVRWCQLDDGVVVLTFVTVIVLHFSCCRALLLSLCLFRVEVYVVSGKYFNSTQLNSIQPNSTQLQKVSWQKFFRHKTVGLSFFVPFKTYHVHETKVILYSPLYLYCSRLYRVCLSHSVFYTLPKLFSSTANEFVSITGLNVVHFGVRACLAWIYWKCVLGHAWIWHDNTNRRQPATMTTMAMEHETAK